jgi:hypothetical protein
MKTINPHTDKFSTSSGKPVTSTQMLKGEAKDSLSGKNSTVAFSTSGSGFSGQNGAKPSRK